MSAPAGAAYDLTAREIGYMATALFMAWLLWRVRPGAGAWFMIVFVAGSLVFNWERLKDNFSE